MPSYNPDHHYAICRENDFPATSYGAHPAYASAAQLYRAGLPQLHYDPWNPRYGWPEPTYSLEPNINYVVHSTPPLPTVEPPAIHQDSPTWPIVVWEDECITAEKMRTNVRRTLGAPPADGFALDDRLERVHLGPEPFGEILEAPRFGLGLGSSDWASNLAQALSYPEHDELPSRHVAADLSDPDILALPQDCLDRVLLPEPTLEDLLNM